MIALTKRSLTAAVLLTFGVLAPPDVGLATPASLDPDNPADAQNLEDVRSVTIEAYRVKRGLRNRTAAALSARNRIESLPPGLAAAASIVGTAVKGSVEIPIIAVEFSNTASPPFPVADLQKELFDGPWPSGTMSDHYDEMSGGKFAVTGKVSDWIKLANNDAFYAGPADCNGICNEARLGEMLTTALQNSDAAIDFTRFDNDGPDNTPNSGDDDGFVDFVAFVHPESGGECRGPGNDNIWSHRFSLQAWTGANFQTNDPGKQGPNILVDDYVIMPALACDRTTMIQIGVFSHEFGHAFGLPDLYDAREPVQSEGVGGWDLMAAGSWGGDGGSAPQTPSHMSAWSKEFLGWVSPRVVETDQAGVTLKPVTTAGDVVKVDYADAADPADGKYLLLEYRTKQGFDGSLAGGGLLVTEINNAKVQSGLVSNSVNDSPFDMGVNIVEADGKRDLDRSNNRGDAGDVFPGGAAVASADSTHAETISAALCNIVQTDEAITLDVFVSQTVCPDSLLTAAVSPAEATSGETLRGEQVVIEGILTNEGTNYFTDRKLVVTGEGAAGGEIIVSAPATLTTALPQTGGPDPQKAQNLSDVLDKKVLLRGHVQRQMQKGSGLTDVFIVEDFAVAE